MRAFVAIFILNLTLISCKSDNYELIKGQWYFCSDEGYSEILFTDSLIQLLHEDVFLLPLQYKLNNNRIVIINEDKEENDTLWFDLLSADRLIINIFNRYDTLTRLNEKVLTYYDYDCNFQMNQVQFDEFIRGEFKLRRLRNHNNCVPEFVQKLENRLILPDSEFEDLDDFFNDIIDPKTIDEIFIHSANVDYQIIRKNIEHLSSPKMVDLKYSSDSTKLLIIIDDFDFCYKYYIERIKFRYDNKLEIWFNDSNSQCEDKCHIRFYFYIPLEYENMKIEKIIYRDIILN
jgi:hypothetical protein